MGEFAIVAETVRKELLDTALLQLRNDCGRQPAADSLVAIIGTNFDRELRRGLLCVDECVRRPERFPVLDRQKPDHVRPTLNERQNFLRTDGANGVKEP